MSNDKGQTLIELMTVITVAIIVIGAITFATIASLRNAQFAKNQSQATKLAQEGLEKVKAGRNRNALIVNYISGTTISWDRDELWNQTVESRCVSPCYFNLIASEGLTKIAAGGEVPSNAEALGEFKRVIVITDESPPTDPNRFTQEKIVTAIVSWNDFAGDHQSRLTTVLRKL